MNQGLVVESYRMNHILGGFYYIYLDAMLILSNKTYDIKGIRWRGIRNNE